MSREELHVGFEEGTGEPVSIPLFHTFASGITRHGKSVTMKALAKRANEKGYTVLIFDVKRPPDYADIGRQIRPYIQRNTDPLTLLNLMEGVSDFSLKFQFDELVDVHRDGDSYEDLANRMERWKNDDDTHPVKASKLRVLHLILEKVREDLETVDIADELELQEGAINVMDLHEIDKDVQQLAVGASVEEILEGDYENLIVLIDEAHRFIPQGGSSAAKEGVSDLIREGGARGIWTWISDQTITGTDKDPLKQAGGAWMLGKQVEKNEAQRTKDQILGEHDWSVNDVQSLQTGHFIVSAGNGGAPKVYIHPNKVDAETARAIAKGEMDMDDIRGSTSEEVEELEEELRERNQELQELREELRRRDETIQQLSDKVERLEREKEAAEEEVEASESEGVEAEVDADRVREIVQDEFEDLLEDVEVPEGITVRKEVPSIEVRREVETVQVSDEDLKGKLALLYAEGDLPDTWFTTGDVYSAMDSRGWSQDPRASNVLKEFCEYGFLRKSGGKYKVDLSPEEAEEKGLLVLEEVVA